MDVLRYILPVLAVSLLCAGWVALQYVARYARTKNHLDSPVTGCGHCESADQDGRRVDTQNNRQS